MPTKLTTSEFIEKARQVHGDRYDYARTVYVNNKRKVIINCPEHGDFEQRAMDHTQGKGCTSCGRIATASAQKLTPEEFIERARQVNGDRYDYSKSVYVNTSTKVTITCRVHGDFDQRPHDHLRGIGCQFCGRITLSKAQALTTEAFIVKARQIHADKYEYGRTEYVNDRTRIIITCPEHGDFVQRPNHHTRGHGCPSCSGCKPHTTETFITMARQAHGERYDYSKSVYVHNKRKVVITCPEHGDFEQLSTSHVRGIGCPSCADYGYQPHKTGYLYFLLDTDTHSRIKIGISNRPDQRLRELRHATPFEFEPMGIIETYGEIAPQLEKLCHDALPSAGLTGFDGATEWMKYEGTTVRQLIETCESYRLLDTLLHMR